MSCVNHATVKCCFSQLGTWADERCSAVERVKTTDVDLPKRESRTMRKRIKRFPSVCWFLFFGSYAGTVLGIVLGLQVPSCSR